MNFKSILINGMESANSSAHDLGSTKFSVIQDMGQCTITSNGNDVEVQENLLKNFEKDNREGYMESTQQPGRHLKSGIPNQLVNANGKLNNT